MIVRESLIKFMKEVLVQFLKKSLVVLLEESPVESVVKYLQGIKNITRVGKFLGGITGRIFGGMPSQIPGKIFCVIARMDGICIL